MDPKHKRELLGIAQDIGRKVRAFEALCTPRATCSSCDSNHVLWLFHTYGAQRYVEVMYSKKLTSEDAVALRKMLFK